MSTDSRKMRELGLAAFLGTLIATGMPAAHAEKATGYKGMHQAHHGGAQMVQPGKGQGGGKHRGHGMGHGRHHLFGDHWKKTLTPEQKVQLDRLHLAFAKKKHGLMSGIRALKVQLAVMAVADQQQPGAVEAHIDNLLTAKRQLMQTKYSYIVAQRKVLTPEQRVSFDMDVIHKADRAKGKGMHGGRRH